MLWVRSLCSNLRDSLGFRCGNYVVVLAVHSFSSCVICNWKSPSMLFRWVPHSFFIRNSVRIVGDLMQSACLILGISSAPPYLANMCWMSH
jgi:hypothetical protein